MRNLLEDVGYLMRHFFYYLPRYGHYKPVNSQAKSS